MLSIRGPRFLSVTMKGFEKVDEDELKKMRQIYNEKQASSRYASISNQMIILLNLKILTLTSNSKSNSKSNLELDLELDLESKSNSKN